MDPLQFANYPQGAALLLRKTYTDLSLPGAIMDRAAEWLRPTAARWNETSKRWTFPSGYSLTFGYLQTVHDHYRYQSSEFTYIGFDELTQFPRHQFKYMYSRLRKPKGCTLILKMRGATNPGGIGHEWVYEDMIDPQTRDADCVFIPALHTDNPHLDERYIEMLNRLDPVTRAHLRDGLWDVMETGGMFDRTWFPILDTPPPDHEIRRRVRYWDLAATEKRADNDPDWSVGLLMAECRGWTCVLDVVRGRWSPKQLEDVLKATAQQDGFRVELLIEQEPGSSGKIAIDAYKRLLVGHAVQGVTSSGDKVTRARPASAASERREIRMLRAPWNQAVLATLHAFPHGAHDDDVDALAGAYNHLNPQAGPARGYETVQSSGLRGSLKGW